jgi:hypothetical protein
MQIVTLFYFLIKVIDNVIITSNNWKDITKILVWYLYNTLSSLSIS